MNSASVVEPGVVVLLHGVGLTPELFDPVRSLLASTVDSIAPLRGPYQSENSQAPSQPVVVQAGSIIRSLDAIGPVLVVGVSGGATLALAIALIGSPNVIGVIAHEPLVGLLADELHSIVTAASVRLARTNHAEAVAEFVQTLVGPTTWSTVPEEARHFVDRHASVIRAEVAQFVAFAPTASQLDGRRTPFLVTTGARSPSFRHAAAAALTDATRARSTVIPGAGHLANWEQPQAFAELIVDQRAKWSEAA